MNNDRYDIKGKIGQGGIGAVYRAWDQRLNRDVAIKRVLPEGGFENEEEAIAHLLKEATALSSVQHPHIVTVYDAGVDDDGPYVVMELLSGRTLDQMIEQGTLVWDDFREVAIQTQEALIAAQDLDLVHRDLKPTNVMVVWLASGKFQIKIVDFGLAKFSPKPSLQTIDHGDAVFGSIHFMAPEQFERDPLDQRTDMYAMGCLYYYALTGLYPFHGDDAPAVMAAHLNHTVTPLQELRPDLPEWVCDWVMWHIGRNMDERPENARQSLQKFLMNEQQDSTPEETPEAPAPRPKFRFPGAPSEDSPPPAPTAGTAPQPLQAPAPTGPTPPAQPAQPATPPPPPATPAAPAQLGAPSQPAQPAQPAIPAAPATPPQPPAGPKPVPQATVALTPAQPPAGTPAAQPVKIAGNAPGAPAASGPVPAGTPGATPAGPNTIISGSTLPRKKKGMSTATKSTIAAVVGIAVIFVAYLLIAKMGQNERNKEISALLAEVADPAARDLPTTAAQVDALLGVATKIGQNSQRQSVYQRLLVAEASDGSDIDARIAQFAANDANQMVPDIRSSLFEVLQGRKSPSAVPYLIEYARSTSSDQHAAAALRAVEKVATADQLADLLAIMRFNPSQSVRQQAKRTIASVAKRTDGRSELAAAITAAYETAGSDEIKRDYLELLGAAGGDDAADIVREALENDDKKVQIAAIAALRNWPDDSMFPDLIDYATGQEDDLLRAQAFDAAYAFLRLDRDRDELDLEDMWKMLAGEARTEKEKRQIIDGMAQLTDDWAFSVVEFFEEDENDKVSFRAEQARERMESRRKRIEGDD